MKNIRKLSFPRRLAVAFTAAVMLVWALPVSVLSALAADAPWEGSGTADDPWRIMTPEDLVSMSEGEGNISEGALYEGKYFALMNDLDMNEVNISPIGNNDYPFAGTFYGCGHKIDNVYSIEGLFGIISNATIQELFVQGSFADVDDCGGIVGISRGVSAIKNCWFLGKVNSYDNNAGGIVGRNEGTVEITGCTNFGEITADGKKSGGIIGELTNEGSKVLYCSNLGNVNGVESVGGIAGNVINNAEIRCCVNSYAKISCSGNLAGGIAGCFNGSSIQYCRNFGQLNDEDAGYIKYIGGIAGCSSAPISNCYSTGDVYGLIYIGGIVGENSGTITNCYNTGSIIASGATTGGIAGFTNAEISYCYNSGDMIILSAAGNGAGGIAGDSKNTKISCCYNTGNITQSQAYNTAGIVGFAENSQIDQCYNLGSIVCTCTQVGGIVGSLRTGSTVSNCYNKGYIEGFDKVGGIVGNASSSDTRIECCYNHSNPYPKSTNKNLVGKIIGEYNRNTDKPTLVSNYYTNDYSFPVWNYDAVGWDYLAAKPDGCIMISVNDLNNQSKFNSDFKFNSIWTESSKNNMPDLKQSIDLKFVIPEIEIPAYQTPDVKKFPVPSEADYQISAPELIRFEDSCYSTKLPAAKTFTVTNTGTRKIFLPELSAENFEITNPKSLTLPAGSSAEYTVRPKSIPETGELSETLNIKGINRSKSTNEVQVKLSFSVFPWEGSGTKEDPWLIKTAEDLVNLSESNATAGTAMLFEGKYFRLEKDIDMSGIDYKPIGSEGLFFSGDFDGNGKTIYNLSCSFDGSGAGLFGRTSRTGYIHDLCVKGNILSGIVSGGIVSDNQGIIERCAFYGDVKATPHNHRLTPLYIIRLHIFRHYYRVNLLTLFSLPCASKAASNLGNLTKNLTARLTHNGCAVLP